jgi:hypothetical protein
MRALPGWPHRVVRGDACCRKQGPATRHRLRCRLEAMRASPGSPSHRVVRRDGCHLRQRPAPRHRLRCRLEAIRASPGWPSYRIGRRDGFRLNKDRPMKGRSEERKSHRSPRSRREREKRSFSDPSIGAKGRTRIVRASPAVGDSRSPKLGDLQAARARASGSRASRRDETSSFLSRLFT